MARAPTAPTVHSYAAKDVTDEKDVELKMCNLRLHSSGVFSNVYRGQLLEPQKREIAMKKTWPGDAAERGAEVDMLMALSKERHSNIVQVLYIMRSTSVDNRICESMIFDFMPANLASLIPELPKNQIDIKLYTWQLFNALYFLYKRKICHRDVKPPNILVDPEIGLLKLGDFGSAKALKDNQPSTAYQVTRFYRPPELLMNAIYYTPMVDVWSGGCVMGEMMRGKVLLPGRNTEDQLKKVINLLGMPTEGEYVQMRVRSRPPPNSAHKVEFAELLPQASKEAIAFLQKILVYTPKRRRHGAPLLTHQFFHELLEPGIRRKNNQLVADTPPFKDLTETLALHRRHLRTSSENVSTADDVVPRNSKEAINRSAENIQKRSKMARLTNSREKLPSKEKIASKEQIPSAIKKPQDASH